MEEGPALCYTVLEGSASRWKCTIRDGRFKLGVRKRLTFRDYRTGYIPGSISPTTCQVEVRWPPLRVSLDVMRLS